jgi:hypothetical protein
MEVAVSGISTHTSPPAVFFALLAVAPATVIAAIATTPTRRSTVVLLKTFFT